MHRFVLLAALFAAPVTEAAAVADLEPTAVIFRHTVLGGAVSVIEYAVRFRNVGDTTWNPSGQYRLIHFKVGIDDEARYVTARIPPGGTFQIGVGMQDRSPFAHCGRLGVHIDTRRTAGQIGPRVYENDRKVVPSYDEARSLPCLLHARPRASAQEAKVQAPVKM